MRDAARNLVKFSWKQILTKRSFDLAQLLTFVANLMSPAEMGRDSFWVDVIIFRSEVVCHTKA